MSRELELMLMLRAAPHPNVISLHEYFCVRSESLLLLCQVLPRFWDSLAAWLERDVEDTAHTRVARAKLVAQDLACALQHIHELHILRGCYPIERAGGLGQPRPMSTA